LLYSDTKKFTKVNSPQDTATFGKFRVNVRHKIGGMGIDVTDSLGTTTEDVYDELCKDDECTIFTETVFSYSVHTADDAITNSVTGSTLPTRRLRRTREIRKLRKLQDEKEDDSNSIFQPVGNTGDEGSDSGHDSGSDSGSTTTSDSSTSRA
jgi:hypothetical protein